MKHGDIIIIIIFKGNKRNTTVHENPITLLISLQNTSHFGHAHTHTCTHACAHTHTHTHTHIHTLFVVRMHNELHMTLHTISGEGMKRE